MLRQMTYQPNSWDLDDMSFVYTNDYSQKLKISRSFKSSPQKLKLGGSAILKSVLRNWFIVTIKTAGATTGQKKTFFDNFSMA